MTEEEYKKAKQEYEDNKKKLEEEYTELSKQFAKVSKEYFGTLTSLDCGGYYIIDLTHDYDQRIYFKWTEHCSIDYREDIEDIRLSIDKAIVIRNGDAIINHNYHYSTSPDRIIKDLHKIKRSMIDDVVAYVNQQVKNF